MKREVVALRERTIVLRTLQGPQRRLDAQRGRGAEQAQRDASLYRRPPARTRLHPPFAAKSAHSVARAQSQGEGRRVPGGGPRAAGLPKSMEPKKGPLDKLALFLKNLFSSDGPKTVYVPKPAAPPPPKPRTRVVALDVPPRLAWDDAASTVENLFASHGNDVFASIGVVLDSLASRFPGSGGPDPLSAQALPIRDGANIAVITSPSFLARLPESVQYEASMPGPGLSTFDVNTTKEKGTHEILSPEA